MRYETSRTVAAHGVRHVRQRKVSFDMLLFCATLVFLALYREPDLLAALIAALMK